MQLQALLNSPLSKYTALVGRVKSYLKDPDSGVLPVSCTINVPACSGPFLDDLIEYTVHALVTGAGLNVHLDKFTDRQISDNKPLAINFSLHPSHPEFNASGYISYQGWQAPILPPTSEDILVSDSIWEDNQFYYADTIPEDTIKLFSIVECIKQAYIAGYTQEYINFNLSALRPDEVENAFGMVSSGAQSFGFLLNAAYVHGHTQSIGSLCSYLSAFNAVLRRGGKYKNGAITSSLPMWHTSAKEYLELPKETYPWLKQGLVIPSDYGKYSELLPLVYTKVNNGGLWLEKAVIQSETGYTWLSSNSRELENRLRSNVCREILIPNKATCNLGHVNYGQIAEFSQLTPAYTHTMKVMCELHKLGSQDASGFYLSSKVDRQVGVGIIGLSNLLAIHKITYRQHIDALQNTISQLGKFNIYLSCIGDHQLENPLEDGFTPAQELAWEMVQAYIAGAKVAYSYNMSRAFCIAPTANCSFRHEDINYWTTSPEISPPMAHSIERISETQQDSDVFFYHPDAELASNVGWDTYFDLVDTYQLLMNCTGLAHSISFNIWEDIDNKFMRKFAESNILTTYYRMDVDQSALNKATQFEPKGGAIQCACAG